MILMALKAAALSSFFGSVLAMALLTSVNAGQQYVGSLAAIGCVRMARTARHHAMWVMIKLGMGQPASRKIGFCHLGEHTAARI